MNCHNCKNPLRGDEDFCPKCAAPLRFTDADSGTTPKKDPPLQEPSIFQNEPVYIYPDASKEKTKKPRFTMVFVSLFIITVLGIGAFSLAEYFRQIPVFSQLFPTSETTVPADTTTLLQEPDNSIGTILPDINLKTMAYTVTAERGLSLRKGPDNAYATVCNLPYGTGLHLVGKGLTNDLWVYVYVPSDDIYGWVMASYITESALMSQSSAQKEESYSRGESQPEAEAEEPVTQTATITAEKGLYLRQGPGTEYEIIDVVSKGETVTLLQKDCAECQWLYVIVHSQRGYMNKTYLSL